MAGRHLLVAPGLGTAAPLADVLARLARRHAVHAHDPGLGTPAAVLTRPASRWPAPRGVPVAWWVDHPAALPSELPDALRCVLTWQPVVDALGAVDSSWRLPVPVEVLPSPSVDGTAWRPVAPFVRARWRRRLGLPATLVAMVGTAGAPPMDDQTAADALFLCSAAVAGPAHVLRSLALGTPTVCDAATAALVGARDRHDVAVASGDDARAAAEELAVDVTRAATLARNGRRLVEARHDVAASARRVAALLDLPETGAAPVARVAARLDELGTPVDAGVVSRVAGAIGTLGPDGVDVAVRSLRW
jgi:hypothetical protein